MRMMFLVLICLPGVLAAQDWAVRDGDAALSRADLQRMTEGPPLVFYDDGTSRFSAGGSYSYSYANGGGTAFGTYEIGSDGEICIAYRNGFSRCDRYVRNGGRLVLLTEAG